MPDRLECSKSTDISDVGFSSPENNEVKSAAHSENMWTTLVDGSGVVTLSLSSRSVTPYPRGHATGRQVPGGLTIIS